MGTIVVDAFSGIDSGSDLSVSITIQHPTATFGIHQMDFGSGTNGSTTISNDGTVSTTQPVCIATCTPSLGSGVYSSFQWSITETSDISNVYSIHTTGTQTNQTYNGLRLQVTRPASGSGITIGSYTFGVTVTDSNGDTATASAILNLLSSVPFGGGGGGFPGGPGGGGGGDDDLGGDFPGGDDDDGFLIICLHYTVLVNTEKGLVSIKDLERGMKVWSWNFSKGEKELVDIEDIFIVPHDNLWSVGGLLLTEDHPMYTESGEAVAIDPAKSKANYGINARKVVVGDRLKTLDNSVKVIDDISRYEGNHPTYTLKTKNRNFFADNILVDGEI